MREKRCQKKMTRESLKMLSGVLLIGSILGCASGPAKSGIEFWRIDEEGLVLYRIISDNKEAVIEIPGNKYLRKNFVCSPVADIMKWVEVDLHE